MKLYDFSKRFSRVAEAWIKQNAGKYKVEELEARVPDLYVKWLNTPASWLDGATPAAYFDQFDDAVLLVDMLKGYCKANIAAPDPLLDRISTLGEPCVQPLLALFADDRADEKPRAMAGALLVEIGSAAPLKTCVEMISRTDASADVREQAVAILRGLGGAAEQPLLTAMEHAQGEAFSAYLDVLLDCSTDPRLYDWAVYGLRNQPEHREVFASFLLRLGDERAVEPLSQLLNSQDLGYLQYMEICNAIESLGGEVRVVREFSGDADYEQLRQLPVEEESSDLDEDKPRVQEETEKPRW